MTATERGKTRACERASARCSRARITPTAVSVGSIGNTSVDDAVLEAAGDPVAGVAEDSGSSGVVGEHLGDERSIAALAARLREVFEQQLTEAAALVGVLDEEGDLGDVRRGRGGRTGRPR